MGIKFFDRLNFKITIGIVATLAIILSISTYLLYRYQREQWIESLRTSTTNVSALIRSSLQYAMLGDHLDMIDGVIRRLAQEESLQNIMILDKKGTVKFASDPVMVGINMTREETTCLICHQHKPENRATTIVYTTPSGERVFRNVNPIFNDPECHRCHDASEKLNGVLMMDFSMADVNQALKANVKKVLLWTLIVIGVMSAVLWLLLNRLVIHRLFDFLKHTSRVGRGELDAMVDESGADELAQLAHNFNQMTEDLKEYIKIKEIKLQKEQLEKLVNSIDEGVLVVNREDRVVAANDAVSHLMGRPTEELVGKICGALFNEEEADNQYCLAEETFRTGTLHKTIRSFRNTKDEEIELEIYASPIKDSAGNVYQVVEVIRDITERKKLEAELIHSERLASLGLLASGISHEIKNPLASITTCIEGLQRMLKKSSSPLVPEELNKFNKYLGLSKKEAERCKIIPDKLLFLSRKSIPSTESVDVNQCLEETISLLESESTRREIEVMKDFDPFVPHLQLDQSDLREVFFNLILNAIQAIEDEGGRLSVRTGMTDDWIQVTISDTGKGIAKEDMGKIFEPFFTRKPPGKGTGLGLYICRNLMDKIGGTISVKSSPGEGTDFFVRLPIAGKPADMEEKAV